MKKIFTIKPIISNKALLAFTLAVSQGVRDIGDNNFEGIEKSIFATKLGSYFLTNMELLNDKRFAEESFTRLKNEVALSKIAKGLKKSLLISNFMIDVSDSISKGYISFSDIAIENGDYFFHLKTEFCLANYIAMNNYNDDNQLDLKNEITNLYEEFKKDPQLIKSKIDYLIESNLFKDFTEFSADFCESTLSQALGDKRRNNELIIKGLIDSGIGCFSVLT